MASPSSSSSASEACECGRDGGDGGTEKCQDCFQWVCSNKCAGMPGIVYTDKGTYCTDCVESIILIYPDPLRPMTYIDQNGKDILNWITGQYRHYSDECDRCNKNVFRDTFISLADCIICRDCLTTIVKEACGK